MCAATIRLGADLAEVARMNQWYADTLAASPLPEALIGDMKLCLNEAAANTISYGFDGIAGPVLTVTLDQQPDGLTAVLQDNGIAFDPLAGPVAAPLTDLASAGIGGFGLKLIRETASALHYVREAGWNRLTISCRLA